TITVASDMSSVSACSAKRPEATESSIADDAPNVERTELSNSASAVRTTTRVRFVLPLRPIRMALPKASYLTAAAGAVVVGPVGPLGGAAAGAESYVLEVPMPRGVMTRLVR